MMIIFFKAIRKNAEDLYQMFQVGTLTLLKYVYKDKKFKNLMNDSYIYILYTHKTKKALKYL